MDGWMDGGREEGRERIARYTCRGEKEGWIHGRKYKVGIHIRKRSLE